MTDSAENTLQDEQDSASANSWAAEREAHAAMVMAVSLSAMAVVEQAQMVAENALASAMRESPFPPVVPEEQATSTKAAHQSAPPSGSEGTEPPATQPAGTAPDSPAAPEASPA